MKNIKKVILWSIGVVVLTLLILPKLDLNHDNNQSSKSQNPESKLTGVNVKIIKAGKLQDKIFSNGTLISNEQVELRSEISGKITAIYFEEGRKVKKGDLLIKINDSELQATAKKNAAKVTLAKDKEFRFKQLIEKNLTSQQEYDVAINELNVALADAEFTQAQIEKTEIRAPFDGVIGLRSVSVGSYISPTTMIASLQSINPIKVDFAVPQKYFGVLKEGKIIHVRKGSTDRVYEGRVFAVEPKIDEATRSVKARAIIPNERAELTPGAYVEIDIVLQELSEALMVPTDVIVPDIEGEKVYVYKKGKAIQQKVLSGIRTDKEIQILSGLNFGDTLITSGIIQLRPNTAVKINSVE